jgi:hypothetical protein
MTRKLLLLGSTISALVLASLETTAVGAGTDILHFSDRAAFTNNGVVSSASGTVSARENKQGNADNETVDVALKKLDTNAPYSLLVTTDDTNRVDVADFTTDKHGKATVNFRKLGNGHGVGHGNIELPAAMDPVVGLRTFTVVNADTNAVLTADLTTPAQFQFLVKRDMSTNDIKATLSIQANNKKARLSLTARGLPGTNDYLLVLNGNIAQTNSANAHGHLEMAATLDNPADALDLKSVIVSDTASNIVLSTTLP